MHEEYFKTRFRMEPGTAAEEWPTGFAIISAYATTGQQWTDERNCAADHRLHGELRGLSRWLRRIVGCSPSGEHSEPSWAVEMTLDEACEIGLRYKQDAVYYVTNGELAVSHCDHRRGLVPVDRFRDRLEV